MASWNSILDKLRLKLSIWKAKTLSFGGRITLAKAILGSLPTFFLSIFGAPIGVINSLEKLRRQFIWGGPTWKNSIKWVALEKVTTPKSVGGLGIRSIRSLNLALLTKWMWRLKNEPNSLWVLIINGLHKSEGEHNRFCTKKNNPWRGIWKNIVKSRKMLEKINIHFEDVMRQGETNDTWVSSFVRGEQFCVAALHDRIERASFLVCDGNFPWLKLVPLKVLGFVWRVKQNRIPSAGALKNKGVAMVSTICGVCKVTEETRTISSPHAHWRGK